MQSTLTTRQEVTDLVKDILPGLLLKANPAAKGDVTTTDEYNTLVDDLLASNQVNYNINNSKQLWLMGSQKKDVLAAGIIDRLPSVIQHRAALKLKAEQEEAAKKQKEAEEQAKKEATDQYKLRDLLTTNKFTHSQAYVQGGVWLKELDKANKIHVSIKGSDVKNADVQTTVAAFRQLLGTDYHFTKNKFKEGDAQNPRLWFDNGVRNNYTGQGRTNTDEQQLLNASNSYQPKTDKIYVPQGKVAVM